MSKHRPGPWRWRGARLEQQSTGDPVLRVTPEVMGSVALVSDADAAVIAAAPELLEAMKKAVRDLEEIMRTQRSTGLLVGIPILATIEDFKALIAKAEGK